MDDDQAAAPDQSPEPSAEPTQEPAPEPNQEASTDVEATPEPEEGQEPAQPEEKPTLEESEPKEAPDSPKTDASEHYYKRQLRKKDEYIAKLEQNLNENYVGNAGDETEQRLRTVETQAYVNKVQAARSGLVIEHERAVNDIPLFNPDSPQYNKTAAETAMRVFAEGFLETDEDGEVVGSKASLYDFLQQQADVLKSVSSTAAQKGQAAEQKMRAIAETPSSAPDRGDSSSEDSSMSTTQLAERHKLRRVR